MVSGGRRGLGLVEQRPPPPLLAYRRRQGRQPPGLTFGVGLSYGYSWRIAPRLNLDVGLSVGYTRGELIKYRPACDTYTCTWRGTKNYFGPTGLHVTLVWWPGAGRHNNPDYEEP